MNLAILLAREDLEWRFEGAPAPYVLVVVALGVAAFVVTAYLLEPRGEERSRAGRFVLGLFRAAALMIAIGILFRPVERRETRETKDGYVVVAIDRSRSMSLKDREGDERFRVALANALGVRGPELKDLDRMGRAKRAVAGDHTRFLEQLAARNKVRVYTFDASRNRLGEIPKLDPEAAKRPLDPGEKPAESALAGEAALTRARQEVRAIEAEGAATAVGDALQKILGDLRSEKVAGLILLTDGRSNAGSLQAEQVALRFGKKGIPIYAVGIGDPNPPKDLAIENLEAPEVTIAGDNVSFGMLLKAQGYEAPRDVDVELVVEGRVVERKRVVLGGPTTERNESIKWKPEREGEFKVEVRIPPDEAEITVENNRALHQLRVIAQRIKVLYLEGYPRWEYRYLKNAMVRDSKLEVQCLLLSADQGFYQETSRGVLPLKGFPSREELFQYHVLVLGDVSPQALGWDQRPVFPEGALESIKEFVADQGGGLVMIAGEQDSPRRWAQTPVGPLLPIVIDEQEGAAPREWTEAFAPRITREGARTQILDLENDKDRSKTLWEGPNPLPGFYWYSRALKAKPLARVLAEHPTDRNQNGPYPIWAWHYFKSGIVFWSAVDETWRWRAGIGDRYMYSFWQRVLRHAATGKFQRSKRFLLSTDKATYVVGEEARVRARVLDRQFKPATEKTQEVLVERPDAQTDKLELKLIEEGRGEYEARYRPPKMGRYRVSIDPGQAGSDTDVAPRFFDVKFPSIELEEPRMDQPALEAVAKASGGEFLRLERIGELPEKIPPMTETVAASATERELWDQSWVLGLMAALLIAEWIGRKLARLL